MGSYYYLQSKDKNGKIQTVGHSQDEKTGEIYCKFLDKSKAKKLMADEMKVAPEYSYRIVREIIRTEVGSWQVSNSDKNDERIATQQAMPKD